MKSMRVGPWFALRFLVKYLRTNTYDAGAATRIGKAADAGNIFAKPVNRLMMLLSPTYEEVHRLRRGLERGLGSEVSIDGIMKEYTKPKGEQR